MGMGAEERLAAAAGPGQREKAKKPWPGHTHTRVVTADREKKGRNSIGAERARERLHHRLSLSHGPVPFSFVIRLTSVLYVE